MVFLGGDVAVCLWAVVYLRMGAVCLLLVCMCLCVLLFLFGLCLCACFFVFFVVDVVPFLWVVGFSYGGLLFVGCF